jgi:hypothetical protein
MTKHHYCDRPLLVVLVSAAMLVACKSPAEKNLDSLAEAKRLFEAFLVKKDTNLLANSYQCIRSNREFREEGLTTDNYDLVLSQLMYLRKYDELEYLVEHSNSVIREKEMIRTLIKALRIYSSDSLAAYNFVDDMAIRVKSNIDRHPKDSLLYVDYFVLSIYKNGRQETLSDLDSFKLVDTNFSESFYENVLRDVILEYPSEYLFLRSE